MGSWVDARSTPSGEVARSSRRLRNQGRGRRRPRARTTSPRGRTAGSEDPAHGCWLRLPGWRVRSRRCSAPLATRPASFASASALPGPADHSDRVQVSSSKAYGRSKRKGRRNAIARPTAPAIKSGTNSWPAPSIDVRLELLFPLPGRTHRLDQALGLADGHDCVLGPVVQLDRREPIDEVRS